MRLTPTKLVVLIAFVVLVVVANNWLNNLQQPLPLNSAGKDRTFEHTWKMKFGELTATWESPWARLMTPDSKDTDSEIIQLFRHENSDSFLLIRVTKDVPKSELSDEQFLGALKDQILAVNSKNKFVDEGKVNLFDTEFNRLRFSAESKNIPTQIWEYNQRDGKKSWSVQIIFPSPETPHELPEIYHDFTFEFAG